MSPRTTSSSPVIILEIQLTSNDNDTNYESDGKSSKGHGHGHGHGHDQIVVLFTTTCAISAYHHYSCVWIPVMVRCTRYNLML